MTYIDILPAYHDDVFIFQDGRGTGHGIYS